jgi:clan AA aspartic protease (TIGR02281 family)
VSPIVDTSKADIVDTSHVDEALASARRNEETARKRATILAWGRATLLGGVGVAAVIAAASLFWLQPRIIERTIEKQVVVEKQVEKELPHRVGTPKPPVKVAQAPKPEVVQAPPPPPKPAEPPPIRKPWADLSNKQYLGILTDVIGDHVCLNHNLGSCIWDALMDGKLAKLDPEGNPIIDHNIDFEPMHEWIGHSVYSAVDPDDPTHLSDYWVADNGEMVRFHNRTRGDGAKSDSVTLDTDGQSLFLDVGLGGRTYPFTLDTGATSMTVTSKVAAQLVLEGHAKSNGAETVTYADGKPHTIQTVTIDAVQVGTHVIHDVHAGISPVGAPMLLGLNVLNAIGRFEVDARHRTLTFNGATS